MPDQRIKSCPFIGLKEDRNTLVGFPSTGNFCFNCIHPTVPQIEHQSSYCLSEKFVECQVYNQKIDKPFPSELRAQIEKIKDSNSFGFLIPVLLFLLALIGIGLWKIYPSNLQAVPTNISTILLYELKTETPVPTIALDPLIVPTLDLPTQAPTSTNTAVPTGTLVANQIHSLDVKIPVDGNIFLIHEVQPKENFVILIKNYNTTIGVIRALNYQMPNSLWANLAIVVSPDMTTVHPNLPSFEPYKVIDAAVSIDDLAIQTKVDQSLLRKFNNCMNGCILREGDWILLPHPQ